MKKSLFYLGNMVWVCVTMSLLLSGEDEERISHVLWVEDENRNITLLNAVSKQAQIWFKPHLEWNQENLIHSYREQLCNSC